MTTFIYNQLVEIHTSLFSRFRKYNLDLQALTDGESNACIGSRYQTIQYLRPQSAAQTVEAMMGRDVPSKRIEARRHPVIELRPAEGGFALELLIAPDAWWDQQNLVAKLSVEKHLHSFYKLIGSLDERYCLGFWEGTHLDNMHVTARQLIHPRAFTQWMSTFCDGQDWFRVGIWYDEEELRDTDMTTELFKRAGELYEIYKFAAWTGNNDFRTLQQRKSAVCYA